MIGGVLHLKGMAVILSARTQSVYCINDRGQIYCCSEMVREMLGLRTMGSEVGIVTAVPMLLYVDNQAVVNHYLWKKSTLIFD